VYEKEESRVKQSACSDEQDTRRVEGGYEKVESRVRPVRSKQEIPRCHLHLSRLLITNSGIRIVAHQAAEWAFAFLPHLKVVLRYALLALHIVVFLAG
jgi:hypothetical protein